MKINVVTPEALENVLTALAESVKDRARDCDNYDSRWALHDVAGAIESVRDDLEYHLLDDTSGMNLGGVGK